jgi:hypothetical protein
MQDGADVNAFQTNDYHRNDFVCDLHTLTTSKEFLGGLGGDRVVPVRSNVLMDL